MQSREGFRSLWSGLDFTSSVDIKIILAEIPFKQSCLIADRGTGSVTALPVRIKLWKSVRGDQK